MGKDKQGVSRGRCNECDCEEFEVEDMKNIKCDYCGHPPGQHEIMKKPFKADTCKNISNKTIENVVERVITRSLKFY